MKGIKFQQEVTFTIKTFERPRSFVRLIRSLEKVHPNCTVLVVDDSKKPYAESVLDGSRLRWMLIPCKPGIGLGAGRNLLLEHVDTPYFVLFDDDYEIQKPVMVSALRELKRTDCDLVAVTLRNTIKRKEDAICQNAVVAGDRIIQTKVPFTKVGRANMVNNCFIAKADSIRNMGAWDPVFQIAGEHTDFAIRASWADMHFRIIREDGILHIPDRPRKYRKFRNRSFASLLLSKYGCEKLVQANGKELTIKPGADYEIYRLKVLPHLL